MVFQNQSGKLLMSVYFYIRNKVGLHVHFGRVRRHSHHVTWIRVLAYLAKFHTLDIKYFQILLKSLRYEEIVGVLLDTYRHFHN